MSLLSRVAAPAATHELAGLVAGLLSGPPRPAPTRPAGPLGGPTGLGTSAARIPERGGPERSTVDASAALRGTKGAAPRSNGRILTGPTGLGTSAATRLGPAGRVQPGQTQPGGPAGNSAVPALHCPPAVRDDPALGAEVNDQLIDWAEQVGIYPGQLDRLRAADFGRLLMLAHPDTDDPDRLLAAAKCALAEWATDDYYCDDESDGAAQLLASRLMVADAAVAPAHLPLRYAPPMEQAMREDPVLVALCSGVDHLGQYASREQVHRLRHELSLLFMGYNAEASWRAAARRPPVWEYLAGRQVNSFLPCITLVDAVGGYEVPAAEYTEPRVRRAVTMAATAATLVNDLYSMAKEGHPSGLDFNLPALIAAEEKCSLREAVERSVQVHDELVITFEAEAAALNLTGSPQLKRFLGGVWAWLGGNREWHAGSARYNAA